MAVTSLQLTYSEIRSRMALMMPINRSTSNWTSDMSSDVGLMIRSALRKVYYHASLGPGQPTHQWSFLRPWATLTTNAPYETGTITVVDGVVTGSGTTFPTWATNAWMVYGGKYYEVASRASGTSLTLVNTATNNDASAGTEYQLLQYLIDLPSDFASLAGPMYFSPDESDTRIPLVRRGDIELRNWYQDSNRDTLASEPRFFALMKSAIAQSAVDKWRMAIWPSAQQVWNFKFRYNVQMNDLDGTDQYPPGGAQHSEMILEACLAEVEYSYNDGAGPHTEKARELLMASIELDRQISEADSYGRLPVNATCPPPTVAITNNDYVIRDGYTLADYQT